MTGYQLRRHFADQHGIVLWGATYDCLVRRHDQDHTSGADHEHDGEGDG